MQHEMDAQSYGIAAFSILEALVAELVAKRIFSQAEIVAILDRVAQIASSRGVASNDDAQTGAALLAGKLATEVRHRP